MFEKHTDDEATEEVLEDFEAEGSEDLELYEDGDGGAEEEEESEDEEAEPEAQGLEDDEEEGPESSLDALLDRKAVADGLDEEDEAELFDLFPPSEERVKVSARRRRTEKASSPEFVCMSCRLVKARAQLSDPVRSLCRDCA